MMTMQVNPEERLSARQALMHPWLTRPATKELESAHAAFKVGAGIGKWGVQQPVSEVGCPPHQALIMHPWLMRGSAAGERLYVSPADPLAAGEVRWEGLCCRLSPPLRSQVGCDWRGG